MAKTIARRYFVSGRVQGVGFRYFVQRAAEELGIKGFTRNLHDGRVEVYALGDGEQLGILESRLWKGPMFSRVSNVEIAEAPMLQYRDFRIQS